MKRAFVLVAGLLAVLAVAVGVSGAAQPRIKIAQVDTTRYPLITAVVIAPGSDKLRRVDLVATEDGKAVTTTQSGGGAAAAIGLAIDVSRSMQGGPLNAARSAASSFVKSKRKADSIGIYSFGHQANPVHALDTDPNALAILAAAGAARHDAGHGALRLRDPGQRRARHCSDADEGARRPDRR